MDSPWSQSRPDSSSPNLDDHRNQPTSMPRADNTSSSFPRSRDNTIQSTTRGSRPDFLHPTPDDGPISRDFEHAVVDDDRSINGDNLVQRRGSTSPAIHRPGAGRRRSNAQPNRSRESSPSSRSTSPANSVDAFAESRRRDRANTAESKGPSELEIGVHPTVSGGTHHRRPTFSNGSVHRTEPRPEHSPSAASDVCFPEPEEEYHKIDFEELDEYVAERNRETAPLEHRLRQKLSFTSHGHRPRIFDDQRRDSGHTVPKIVTQSATPERLDSDTALDAKSIIDEKTGELGLRDRRLSFTEPSRYSFFSSELEQTIHAAELGDLLTPGETFRDLFELPQRAGVWWLDVLNPTEDELHAFQGAFGIHRLTVEDILTQEAREKVELFKQYYFVCFRSFDQMDKTSENYMDPLNVYMVVFRQGILTFTYSQSPHAANVRKRIGKLRDYMALTSDWICYAIIDNIVDGFGPVITAIEHETDTIEDQVFVARSNDFSSLLRQIAECRKKVNSLMRLLGGKADVIKGFSKRCNDQYSITPRSEIGLYLSDIQDHVVTMMSTLGHFDQMLNRSHTNHLAQLSVDTIVQGNRANEVLSKITLLATILVPLNLICGLFGMNVPVPGKNSDGLGWFFGILGFIAAIVLFSLAVARRLRLF
ncbi:MAG: hypothetical protein L6R38_006813 [Xanthoria sp. 2 TBL-2021]|nr:MAG: hypothetical protein L6R38_006813 [Xanthoria sp. 2 TBL-2021]